MPGKEGKCFEKLRCPFACLHIFHFSSSAVLGICEFWAKEAFYAVSDRMWKVKCKMKYNLLKTLCALILRVVHIFRHRAAPEEAGKPKNLKMKCSKLRSSRWMLPTKLPHSFISFFVSNWKICLCSGKHTKYNFIVFKEHGECF